MSRKEVLSTSAHKSEVVNMSLRLDVGLHERLRRMSFETKEHMHKIAIRALEAMLKAEKY